MTRAKVGIIGGTGLGDVLMAEQGGETVSIETPFGAPSAAILITRWEGVDVAFVSRHGGGHLLNPSVVPYRANIWALKTLGVEAIIASGATGSLREKIEPAHLVVCDQVIDKTFRREGTFFDQGLVAHVEMAEPFCPRLRRALTAARKHSGTTVHDGGTYVCMEGPQFSTRAESLMHRQWGGDLIGMTCMPEAKLAREAEICYALVALATDYDCWRPRGSETKQADLLEEIIGNLRRATENAIALIRATLKRYSEIEGTCRCRDALKLSIWSDKGQIDPAVRRRLDPLVGRYMDRQGK